MQINIKETILGLTEAAINTLSPKEESERIAKARLAICAECPFRNGNLCGVCSCVLVSMSRATYQKSCPKGKWLRASKIDNTDGLPTDGLPVTEPLNDLTDGKAE
jgi:hypothetical protein